KNEAHGIANGPRETVDAEFVYAGGVPRKLIFMLERNNGNWNDVSKLPGREKGSRTIAIDVTSKVYRKRLGEFVTGGILEAAYSKAAFPQFLQNLWEMIVGPTKALFTDEISNGLDNSTTYQLINWLQLLAHVMDASVLISLLQPSPEPFDLFNDIMLMA
ncbi:pleiotropic drug resistance protein 3-like protein isoform X2, partial [Tanacetum coccineum]